MSAKFQQRIQPGPACPFVDLEGEERDLYHGAGYALASVRDGQIIRLLYLGDVDTDSIGDVLSACLRDGNVWLGMCSCHQFCEPRHVTKTDPVCLARIARLVADEAGEDIDLEIKL